jgi:hypothetical protein
VYGVGAKYNSFEKAWFLLKNVLPLQPSRMASADFIRWLKKVEMAQDIAVVSKPLGSG